MVQAVRAVFSAQEHKVKMDVENPNEFFKTLLQQFHVVSRAYLTFSEHIKISGTFVVEIDNMKKERYVLSELFQSSGHVLSESYCSKSCKILPGTSKSSNPLKDHKETRNRQDKSSSSSTPPSPTKRKFDTGSLPKERHHTDKPEVVAKNTSFDLHGMLRATTSKVLKVNEHDSKKRDLKSTTTCMPIEHIPATKTNNTKELDKCEQVFDEEVIDLTLFNDDLDSPVTIKDENDSDLGAIPSSDEQPQHVASCPSETDPDSTGLDSKSHFEVLSNPSCIAGVRRQYSEHSSKLVTNAVNRFRKFINKKFNAEVNILFTSPEILNEMFLMFFTEARKGNGQEFSGSYMRNMISYCDVFLKSSGYLYSVTKGPQFQSTRDLIKSKLGNKITKFP